jgi:hypothetical protein
MQLEFLYPRGQPLRKIFASVIFAALSAGVIGQASPRSPKDIVSEFVKLDVEGKRLSSEGWKHADELFVTPGPRPETKRIIVIAPGSSISQTGKPDADRDFYFGYEELGTLDIPSLRFVPTVVAEETRSYLEYQVVDDARGGELLISGKQPAEMHLTVSAALDLLRNDSKTSHGEPANGNAERSIRTLEKYPRK